MAMRGICSVGGVALMAALVLGSGTARAEEPWHAQWIADGAAAPQQPGVWHFRRDFDLPTKPERFVVRVSADNRYRLFVNGAEVSAGPARGDLLNWRYEKLDIASHLQAGRNVIAALVWNFGDWRPAAQITKRTAFLLQGEGEAGKIVDTDPAWKVLGDGAYRFSPVVGADSGGYYVAGPNETIDARLYPWGWEQLATDDSRWPAAAPLGIAQARGTKEFGQAFDWQLVPRTIPMPEQRPVRFARLRRASGMAASEGFLRGKGELTVPAHSNVSLLVDNGELTMGYPILVTSGGAGARATLTYAESLFDAKGEKGNRNEIKGKTIRGLRDRIAFDGGAERTFQPLWLRAFRYVQVDVETGDEPLHIRDFHAMFAAYPFVQKAAFSSDAKWIEPIWKLDWHALRLASFETFWDTPYYEQLQYVGDARIEALLSLYESGDDRLMRNALMQFDQSRTPEGIGRSSYPSSTPQFIPPFSLWWIDMVHDYWMQRDDPAFVRGLLPGTRGVIDWFEAHLGDDGLLGHMPWWNFLDWTYKNAGIPPGGDTKGSVGLTLQFVLALQDAADLEEALSHPDQAKRYRALADRTAEAIRREAWDEGKGLFADSPEKKVFGQQSNALAVLAGVVPEDRRRAVMERLLADPTLVPASFYFRFYVDEAMRKAGLADRYLDRLGPWQDMLRNGLTATAETPEPSRSDSHAWSAHPNYQLLATVLGIRPGSPGFRTVRIEPALGALHWAKGQMPHPAGTIAVSYSRRGAGVLQATVDLPRGLSGEFVWDGRVTALQSGINRLACTPECKATKAADEGLGR